MSEKVKSYFKKEIRWHRFSLEHEDTSDFYLTCWQRNRSCWPLLFIRTLIFIGCFSILVSSVVLMIQGPRSFGHWFIFMTNWGLLLNTISSALAWAVSVVEFLKGSKSSQTTLVKLYWAVFNAAVSAAFFITAFYWTMLAGIEQDNESDFVLDVFVHGINSVLMFCLLITARHPTRLLHFYIPVSLGIVYMLFTLIYYLAGGLSPFNTSWIYPVLDWSQPGGTILWVVISMLLIIVIHVIVVGMTFCRDTITKCCRETTV